MECHHPHAASQPLLQALVTVDLEGVVCLEVAGSRLTEHRKHVDKVVEGEVPVAILRKRLHNPFLEGILLKKTTAVTIDEGSLGGTQSPTAMAYVTLNE